ncbi:tRNA lysidine(34) synthetase TilS [Tateyamaria sp. SN6-1]|uniref:tRNA lysidine(34) synthetase TilS n=1 Tax=Tateyamaria sp. SN6-1 TaxID=3092148 RepID=UPI0039F4BDBC
MLIDPLIEAIDEAVGHRPPERMGVAVSGGGDSIALLSALARYTTDRKIDLHVITIDHGLRPEFKSEVAVVTSLCQKLNLQHHLEYWSGWDGAGNMQAEAREGRYALMADWAYAHQIEYIALGHTADDQAETFLMRLARSAGVDGLSAMSPRHVRHGITWVRPFLRVKREDLRLYLQAAGLQWADDPSNANRDFERVRVRDAITLLATVGVSVEAIVDVTEHMKQARDALDWQTFLVARDMVQIEAGAVLMDVNLFRAQPVEIKRRLLIHSIMWLTGHPYPARREGMARVMDAVNAGQTMTLQGCQFSQSDGCLWIYRELNALADVQAEVGDMWDERWMVDGPEEDPDIIVRALGYDALSELEGWRERRVPRAALAVTPSVWYKGRFVAAPVITGDDDWTAELEGGADGFFAALLSH